MMFGVSPLFQQKLDTSVPNWSALVDGLIAGDAASFDLLYQALAPVRFYLWERIGEAEVDDLYHATLADLVTQVRRGHLRQPERLLSYGWGIARNKVLVCIRGMVFSRKTEAHIEDHYSLSDSSIPDPEEAAIKAEQREIASRILRALSPRDREILIRFYLNEQPPEQVQAEMGITETQFRLVKSRAKQRFQSLCKARLNTKARTTAFTSGSHPLPVRLTTTLS